MSQNNARGFTLVELLVIAPIALLVITGFIAIMVTMVGDIIVSRSENAMTYDVQSALTSIERDVRLSTEFLTTSGTLPSPQGKNGTTPFTSASGDLILGTIATNKNPVDPTRTFTYYLNAPNNCTSSNTYQNRVFFITVIYTVRDGSLWRRTYVPAPSGTLCQAPWQVNTCAPDDPNWSSQCQANDSLVLKNIKNFDVKYFINPEDSTPVGAASAPTASSISVTLEAESTPAGRTISTSSSARSTKLSSQEVNLAPPSAPSVTGSASGRDAVFSWPGVPTASSYIVKYNINGSGWVTASENTTETTFSIPALPRGGTASVEVAARNTTGASSSTTASVTIPMANVMTGLHTTWQLSGTAVYNNMADGLVLGSNGTATSPLIGVRQAATIWLTSDVFASSPSPNHTPNAGWITNIYYYGSDGTTPVQNVDGYTSNGCARGFPVGSWQTSPTRCTFNGGPNVHYVKFTLLGAQSPNTSPSLKMKNPSLTTNLSPKDNLAANFIPTWTLTGTASYNTATGELTLGANGSARSPVVRVDRPRGMQAGGDVYATASSAHASLTPDAGYHMSIWYYGEDGATPVTNNTGHTTNGCAKSFTRSVWQKSFGGCVFTGGPNIVYANYTFWSAQSGYTSSDFKVKTPLLYPYD